MASERSISVVIAVFDGEAFIGDALRSIEQQTSPALEVCVVDDGSKDGTGDVVRGHPGVRYLRRETNAGQASALNWGVASTSGELLAFLDADDIWVQDKLELQLRALDTDPELDIVYGMMRERVLAGANPSLARRDGAIRPAELPSAMLIRRTAFERVGGFDAQFTLGSVVDFYARACDAGLRHRILPQVLYERRIHGENVGIRRAGQRQDYLAVVKAALDRRRALAASVEHTQAPVQSGAEPKR